MDAQVLQAQRDYWNRTFAEASEPRPMSAHWVDELARQTVIRLGKCVLEIGCGRGYDTRYLLAAGCAVTSLDLSWNALQQVGRLGLPVDRVCAALPAPLPFCGQTFDCVIAGLSLHYFGQQDTDQIVQEIRRVLAPGGQLIFRVNSAADVAHGAGRGEEIEPGLFFYAGRTKRFYSEQMVRALFVDADWTLDVLVPWVETRFGAPKPTWMGVARRGDCLTHSPATCTGSGNQAS